MNAFADDLRGKVCDCVFALPIQQWPFPGWPARVVVEDAEMGMVKMRSPHSDDCVWVSAAIIKTIAAHRSE